MSVTLHPLVTAACSPNNSTFADEEYFSQFILPYDGYLFPFEKNPKENITHLFGWCKKIRICFLILVGAYLLATFVVQNFYMKHREPFRLQFSRFLLFMALGVLNQFCSWRAFMDLFLIIKNYGLHSSVCSRLRYEFIDVWHLLFIVSKSVELGDTFFVVLRKRSLPFMLFFHHATAAFGACILVEDFTIGRFVVAMNAFSLSSWYLNLTLRPVNLLLPSYIRKTIVSLALAQFPLTLLSSLPNIMYTKMTMSHIKRNCDRGDGDHDFSSLP